MEKNKIADQLKDLEDDKDEIDMENEALFADNENLKKRVRDLEDLLGQEQKKNKQLA